MNASRPRCDGRHRRRHRHRIPAVRRADRLGVFAGRGRRGSARRSSRRRGLEALRRLPRDHACGPASCSCFDDRARRRTSCRLSVPVPATTITRRGRTSAVDQLRRSRRRCAPRSTRLRRRDVPGATVGGRIAGTSRPRSAMNAAASSAACSSPSTTGHDRRRVTGAHALDVAAQAAPRARRLRANAARRSAARAAAVSAGVDAVVKMYGRARLTRRSQKPRVRGDEAAERAERLGQRADADDASCAAPRRGRARRALRQGQAAHPVRAAQRVEFGQRRYVAVHREHRVGHDDGALAARRAATRRARRRRGGTPRHRLSTGGSHR